MSTTRVSSGRNFLALLSSFLFMFIFSSSVLAATAEIEAIKQEIRNKGARWQAEETSITKLPVERRLKRVGLIRPLSLPGGAVLEAAKPVAAGTTPANLNYTCHNNYNYVTPIRDQGDCGSCWAFAATAALESQELLGTVGTSCGTPSGLNLSEETLLSCCGANLCGNCNGGYIDSASNFIQSTGLPSDSCFLYPNYTPQYQTPPPCSQAGCPSWQSDTSAIKGWQWVATTSPTVNGLKNALITYGPLVTTMNVYNDFYSYSTGVYSYVGGRGDTYQGGRAVTDRRL